MQPANGDQYAQIYAIVRRIPAGRVASYGQIAELAGLPRRARQVGRALRLAPATLELPWHRVLRADGSIAFPPQSAPFKRQGSRCVGGSGPAV